MGMQVEETDGGDISLSDSDEDDDEEDDGEFVSARLVSWHAHSTSDPLIMMICIHILK